MYSCHFSWEKSGGFTVGPRAMAFTKIWGASSTPYRNYSAYFVAKGALHTAVKVMAKELYRKACDMGEGSGCEYLGRVYERGLGVMEDKE